MGWYFIIPLSICNFALGCLFGGYFGASIIHILFDRNWPVLLSDGSFRKIELWLVSIFGPTWLIVNLGSVYLILTERI